MSGTPEKLASQESVALAQRLIRAESVSGKPDQGALGSLTEFLLPLGFQCHDLTFDEEGTYSVDNLFAIVGDSGPHFCFAGHTDVVPPGDGWTVEPFGGLIQDGKLFGRGAVDMKTSVACFAVAAKEFLKSTDSFAGRISLLITGDEELRAINGTRKMLTWVETAGLVPDVCLVGEPTSKHRFGDEIKVGRRGSLSARITVSGLQGHVAYPEHADNPVPKLIEILNSLQANVLDNGFDCFDPSNMEIVNLHVGNDSRNTIPGAASAMLNIRFNPNHTNEQLRDWIIGECKRVSDCVDVEFFGVGNAFLNQDDALTEIARRSVQEVSGVVPRLSTGGGTSDARFIKDYCPTIEFGPSNKTAHQVDEFVHLREIEGLTKIFRKVLELYFDGAS